MKRLLFFYLFLVFILLLSFFLTVSATKAQEESWVFFHFPDEAVIKYLNDGRIFTNDPRALKTSVSLHHKTATAVMISDRDDFNGASWQPFSYQVGSNVKNWQFSNEDGVKKLYIRFKDNQGKVDEVTVQYTFDKTSPFGGIAVSNKSIGPGQLHVNVSLGAEDNLTGVTDIQISKKSDFSDTGWQPYVTSYKWWPFGNVSSIEAEKIVKEKNGQEGLVYVRYRDGTSNISETYKDSFIYDGSPPQLYVEIPPSDALEQTIAILAYDEFSALGKMSITNDPLFIENVINMPYQENVSWKFDERRVVWVKIQDGVGNETEPYPAYLAPIVTFTPLPSGTPAPSSSITPIATITIPKRPTIAPDKSEKYLEFKKKIEELQKGHKQLTTNQKKLQNEIVQQEKRVSFLEELITKISSFLRQIFGFSSKKKSHSLPVTPAAAPDYYGSSNFG